MTNKGLILLGSLATSGALLFALTRKTKAGPEEEYVLGEDVGIGLKLYDSEGNLVSSSLVSEGSDYIVRVTVKNESEARTLGIGILAAIGGVITLIPRQLELVEFAAGQTGTLNYPMAIPASAVNTDGGIIAWVENTSGKRLAEYGYALTTTAGLVTFSGVVQDIGTGQPLASAEVELRYLDGADTFSSTTDTSGTYQFENLQPGNYRLKVSRTGYTAQEHSFALVYPSGYLRVELVLLAPTGVVLYYKNPKYSGATHWHIRILENGEWRELTAGIPPLISAPCNFTPASNTFLIQFSETYHIASNSYWHGPYVFSIAGPGNYSFDAQGEKLNGVKVISLPKSNNLCRIKGRVTNATEEYVGPGIDEENPGEYEDYEQDLARSVELSIGSADFLPGYVNAGQYFIGTGIGAETGENIGILNGHDITADLKMAWYSHGDGYLWKWVVSNIRLVSEYPQAAFGFNGSIWRVEDVTAPAGYLLASPWSVHARVQSLSGLSSFAVAVLLIDSNGWISAKPYRNYMPGTEIREPAAFPTMISGGLSYVGWPPSWNAEVWAHPSPSATFGLSPDYRLGKWEAIPIYQQAIQRGWVRVA